MTCSDGTRSNDGLGFVLEMVGFLFLRSYFIVCKYIKENGILSDGLFPFSKCLLGLNDVSTKSLGVVSMVTFITKEESRPAGTPEGPSFEVESILRANQA